MCKFLSFIAAFRRREEGIAGIEFGILAPILVMVLLAIVDLGMSAYIKREAHAAAQAGVQYALIEGWEPAAIQAAAQASASLGSTSVSVQQVYGCATTSGVSIVAQGSGCTGGGTAGTYVRVTVQTIFTPILLFDSFGIGDATALVRID